MFKKIINLLVKDTIHESCRNGDLDRVKKLVASGVRVNDEDKEGCTALFYSVRNNHIDVVKKRKQTQT